MYQIRKPLYHWNSPGASETIIVAQREPWRSSNLATLDYTSLSLSAIFPAPLDLEESKSVRTRCFGIASFDTISSFVSVKISPSLDMAMQKRSRALLSAHVTALVPDTHLVPVPDSPHHDKKHIGQVALYQSTLSSNHHYRPAPTWRTR